MKKGKNSHPILVTSTEDEPQLYQTSTFYDREAARARYAPAEYVEIDYVKIGSKYEGSFKK